MNWSINVALVGDRNDSVVAHRAIPKALALAGEALDCEISANWFPTEQIESAASLNGQDGVWCVPASPYRSMEGALRAIQWARENHMPFLGTCGGFQHALIEYARNVLGWADAEHGETAPDAPRAVIAPLSCSLVEKRGTIRILPGTILAAAYGALEVEEGYHCRYGLNPEFQRELLQGPLRIAAVDDAGEVRAVELVSDQFFVGTLFQPERPALENRLPP